MSAWAAPAARVVKDKLPALAFFSLEEVSKCGKDIQMLGSQKSKK